MRHFLAAAIVLVSVVSSARGADVRLDLVTTTTQVITGPAASVPARAAQSPATRPAAAESAVSFLAVPGHDFATRFESGGRTVEVSGSVRALAGDDYEVRITASDRAAGLRSVTTLARLKAGGSVELSRLEAGPFARSTVLTLTPVKP